LGDAIDKVNDLAVGDYKGVCDNLIGLIAIGLADQFGRANEWISIRTPPDSAIVGGHISDSPKPVYIGRANHNGNVHPGKVAYYDGGWHCYIGNGGKEQVYDMYEILVGAPNKFKWSTIVKNLLPANAVEGGHISDSPKPVYIGRANHNGNVHPGKVAYYDGGWHCYIGNGGKEQVYDTFEVLLRT